MIALSDSSILSVRRPSRSVNKMSQQRLEGVSSELERTSAQSHFRGHGSNVARRRPVLANTITHNIPVCLLCVKAKLKNMDVLNNLKKEKKDIEIVVTSEAFWL